MSGCELGVSRRRSRRRGVVESHIGAGFGILPSSSSCPAIRRRHDVGSGVEILRSTSAGGEAAQLRPFEGSSRA